MEVLTNLSVDTKRLLRIQKLASEAAALSLYFNSIFLDEINYCVIICTHYVTFPSSEVPAPYRCSGKVCCACVHGCVCEVCTLERVTQTCSSTSCPKKCAYELLAPVLFRGTAIWKTLLVSWQLSIQFAKSFQSDFKNHFKSHRKIM